MENKIKFLLLAFLFLGTALVLAGNAFGNGKADKMDSSIPSYGNRGITGNISYMDGEGNPGYLILKNGMIVGFEVVVNETVPGEDEANESESEFPYGGLVSYYSFDVDATDDYGDNDGVAVGAQAVEGKLGNAYDFETDENDSISTGLTSEIVDHSFSTSVWIKPESHNINMRIFSQRNSEDGNPTNTFNLQKDGRIWWNMRDNFGRGLTQLTSSMPLSDGKWYHVVTTYNASIKEMKLYVNAGTPAVKTYAGGSWGSVNAQKIGSSPFSNPASFDGVIDELGVWDRVLSAEEVLSLWNGGLGMGIGEKSDGDSTWWNSGWSNKKDIIIIETSGETLDNYSVLVTIPHESGMNDDFSDLRFIQDGQELKYWIMDYIAQRAHVYVKIPQLPASKNTTIEMYYGNPIADSNSNKANTFSSYSSYDYIDSDTRSDYYFTYKSNSNGNLDYYSIAPGYLQAKVTGWNGVQYVTTEGHKRPKYSAARLRADGGKSRTNLLFYPFLDVPNSNIRDEKKANGLQVNWADTGLRVQKWVNGTGTLLSYDSSDVLPDTDWHLFELISYNTNYKIYIDGVLKADLDVVDSGLSLNDSIYKYGFGTDSLDGIDADADYFLYIEKADSEPVTRFS